MIYLAVPAGALFICASALFIVGLFRTTTTKESA